MRATPITFARPRLALAGCLLPVLLTAAVAARADDRFFVPVGPSNDSSSGGSGSSSGGGSSGGGASGSSSSGGYSGPSESGNSSGGGRFFVPMPREPRSPGGGGGSPGGGSGPIWHGDYDPYWGGCYYWGGRYHYWYDTTFGWDPFRPYHPSLRQPSGYRGGAERGLPVFFPPEPPPLGIAPPQRLYDSLPRPPAPPELADFAYAPFYAPLSTRLHRGNLTPTLREDIDAYRAKRRDLLADLRRQIDAARSLDPVERTGLLQRFATAQEPELAELEACAENLRTDLLRRGLVAAFSGSGDWNQHREWRLGGKTFVRPREQTLALEFRVMRAAAFYQEGLSPAQRRLLREIAMDLQVLAFVPGAKDESARAGGMDYFFPETARVQFASDLPASVSTRLATLRSERRAIKSQLRDVLYTRDSESRSRRRAALEELARTQEPQIDQLETLAEEIRLELMALGRPYRNTPPPAVPATLADRLADYRSRRAALQAALATNETHDATTGSRSITVERFSSIDPSQAAQIAALDKMRAEIRADLARQWSTVRPVRDAVLDAAIDAANEREYPDVLWQRYTDYADAVFLPGLSSAQRRLLFDGALQNLELPLPDGERMP